MSFDVRDDQIIAAGMVDNNGIVVEAARSDLSISVELSELEDILCLDDQVLEEVFHSKLPQGTLEPRLLHFALNDRCSNL